MSIGTEAKFYHMALLYSEVSHAILGNINENILSVSFNSDIEDVIELLFVVKEYGILEKNLIVDSVYELDAIHGQPISIRQEIAVSDKLTRMYKHVVFAIDDPFL